MRPRISSSCDASCLIGGAPCELIVELTALSAREWEALAVGELHAAGQDRTPSVGQVLHTSTLGHFFKEHRKKVLKSP